jgi:hypothetical protein
MIARNSTLSQSNWVNIQQAKDRSIQDYNPIAMISETYRLEAAIQDKKTSPAI